MNILQSAINSIIPFSSQAQFIIYTNDYVNSATPQNTAIVFTSLYQFEFTQQANVAYEPLENSTFSSDSKQNTPFILKLTGTAAPQASNPAYTNADYLNAIASVESQIQTYLQGTTLLTILQTRPIFKVFNNLVLTSENYSLTNQVTALYANLTFQEVRTTATQYGALPPGTVKNPSNTSNQDQGIQTPISPPAAPASIESAT